MFLAGGRLVLLDMSRLAPASFQVQIENGDKKASGKCRSKVGARLLTSMSGGNENTNEYIRAAPYSHIDRSGKSQPPQALIYQECVRRSSKCMPHSW